MGFAKYACGAWNVLQAQKYYSDTTKNKRENAKEFPCVLSFCVKRHVWGQTVVASFKKGRIFVLTFIEQQKLLPVVTIRDLRDATATADALVRGGLRVLEVTFRTSCAADALRLIAARADCMAGAGTVTDGATAALAIDCGARFVVSPGFSADVWDVCRKKDVLYLPGCVTPTEVMQAISYGMTTVKFFPCTASGGIPALRALAAAFPAVRFLPTGGIDLANLAEYLSLPAVLACGGSFMLATTPEETARRTAEAVALLAAREVLS